MDEQISLLKSCWSKVAQQSRVQRLVIYVKFGKAFASNLSHLQFPEDTFTVLIVSSKLFCRLNEEQKSKFAITLQIDKGKVDKNWRDLSTMQYEDLNCLVTQIIGLTAFENGRYLITLEEPLVRFCALLRSEHMLKGLKFDRVGLFVDKVFMHEHAKAHHIMCPEFLQICCGGVIDLQGLADGILKRIQLPLYVKPRNGCASVGNKVINTNEELNEWISESQADPTPYLVEEFINGDEYTVYMFIYNDVIVHKRVFINEHSVGSFVTKGLPICKLEIPANHTSYKKLCNFAEKVALSWMPIPNGIFFVQFFVDRQENFILMEVCCRMPGGKYAEALWRSAHICLEELHILATIKQFKSEMISKEQPYVALFRYPRREGTIASLNSPEDIGLLSECYTTWMVNCGDIMHNPRGLAGRHEAVNIILINKDYNMLLNDYKKIVDEYRPFILRPNN